MLNTELFKERISDLQVRMQSQPRGELDAKVESMIVAELSSIYLTMVDRFATDVKNGSSFPALQRVADRRPEDRVFYALLELLERMELDFSQKFALDLKHGLEKETTIGKIKISFLDGVRRTLIGSRNIQ